MNNPLKYGYPVIFGEEKAMRVDYELTYQDMKDGIHDYFVLIKDGDLKGAEHATNTMIDEWNDLFEDGSVETAMWFVGCVEYEIRHNQVEERMRGGAEYYIPKIENGEFNADILEGESEELMKDIAFVKETLDL